MRHLTLLHVGTHADLPEIGHAKLWQRTTFHAQGVDEQHVDTRLFASGTRGAPALLVPQQLLIHLVTS